MYRDGEKPTKPTLSRRAILKAAAGGVAANLPVQGLFAAKPKVPPHDIASMSATRLATAIRRREVSCVEVVDAYLRRIEALNPSLNALVQLNADSARASAIAADRALTHRGHVGPLHGVPITVKDSFDTAGIISTAGTTGRRSFVPSRDATVVTRLRSAGAIILGKSNTPELTLSYETDNLVYGRTNNPYDLTRTPGGSSGGAGAAIAAGCSPLDICSDTGGSIRVPSHFCGIAGLKPTSGRVPRTGHIISSAGVFQAFTQPGPMARRVEDLITVLPILAGPDGLDPWIAPIPLRDPNAVSLRGLRIRVHGDNGIRMPSESCIRSVHDAGNALSAAGCRIEEFKPSEIAVTYDLGNRLWRVAGATSVKRLLAACGTTEVSPPLRPWLKSAATAPSEEWTALLEQLDRSRSRGLALFEGCDALLCPPCGYTALEHGATMREDLDSGFSYSEVFNYLGWPSAVVRCGTTAGGLPVGVQIVAAPWREDIVLAVARVLETSLGGWQPPSI
jgi:amidase